MEHIDLHSHTVYSDGTSTVENSLTCAEALGLSVFSVTDHNTVGAYSEIIEKRSMFSGKILPGVELSTVFEGEVIEILGYGIDVYAMDKLIKSNYLSFYDKQVKEAKLDTLAVLEYGAVLDDWFVTAMLEHPESVFDPNHKSNREYLLAEMKRHPENARFFSSEEEFYSIDRHRFSRDYLFNSKSTLYSDQSSLSPSVDTVILMIHDCGGLAFLAHAFVYSAEFPSKLGRVADLGLDGMECFYGTFTPAQKEYMSSFCKKRGIYKSGGSDFHGLDMRPMNLMGFSAGERIDISLVSEWISLFNDRFI